MALIFQRFSINMQSISPVNNANVKSINSVVMALAGAGRIFELIDTEPEQDEGYVTLVNAKEENGKLVETKNVQECGHGNIHIMMEL